MAKDGSLKERSANIEEALSGVQMDINTFPTHKKLLGIFGVLRFTSNVRANQATMLPSLALR